MKKCAKCDFEYDDAYDGCPQCAQEADSEADSSSESVSLQLALGLAGCALLFVGVFMPIVSLPIVGSVNYFNNGQGDGIILFVLAIVSAALILAKRYRGLLVTSALSLVVLGYSFYALTTRLSEAKASLEEELAGNPFSGLAQTAMQSVQLQWGWAVLVLGAVLLLAAGIVGVRGAQPGGRAASGER